MKQEGLAYFTDTHWTLLALFLFLISFIGIVLWTYRKRAKTFYENEMARKPLEEDENEPQW